MSTIDQVTKMVDLWRRDMSDAYDEIKEQIKTAAKDMFCKYGYTKTSMKDIANHSNKSKSSIYHYFENKESVFVTVVKDELNKLLKKSCDAASKESDPIAKLHAFIFSTLGRVGEISAEYGNIIKKEFFEFLPIIKDVVIHHLEAEIYFIKTFIDAGVENGIFFVENSYEAAMAIQTSFVAFSEDSPAREITKISNSTAELLFDFLIQGLKKGTK